MRDTSTDELKVNIFQMDHFLVGMREVLDQGGTKTEFLELIEAVEKECAQLRAAIIRHSRAWKAGMRADGKPDRRFKKNRTPSPTDLRFNQA